MLFKSSFIPGIRSGEITVAFRQWKRPTVKAGGTLITQAGQLSIISVEKMSLSEITDSNIRAAGFPDRKSLMSALGPDSSRPLYRIHFRLKGPDPRIELRNRTSLDQSEREKLPGKLSRMGSWTKTHLELIRKRPGTRAGDLAPKVGKDLHVFKRDIRKLKNLGLTESLEVGYRLSPFGTYVLGLLEQKPAGFWRK